MDDMWKKVLTLLLYIWSLVDFASDIWVGVDYLNRCHYNWAIATFFISFLPQFVFCVWFLYYLWGERIDLEYLETKYKIMIAISFPITIPIVGFLLPFINGYFILKALCSNDGNLESWNRDCKRFKSLTMLCESIPQLVFTSYLYIQVFHDPRRPGEDLPALQIISMIISMLSIILGLVGRHFYVHRNNENIGLEKLMCYSLLIVMDMLLKLAVVLMSILMIGLTTTLILTFVFVTMFTCIMGIIIRFIWNDQTHVVNDTLNWLWYSVEVFHIVVTHLPFERGFDNLKRVKLLIKTFWYFLFFLNLLLASLVLHLNPSAHILRGITFEPAANEYTAQPRTNCKDLCNTMGSKDCSTPTMTLEYLQYWLYFTWALFFVSLLGYFFGLYGYLMLQRRGNNQHRRPECGQNQNTLS